MAPTWMRFPLLLAVALCSCGGDSPPPRTPPNVLFVTIDTLRADHLGCYGGPQDTSPAIDRFAGRAIRYDRAFTAAPLTAPSHSSLLSGLHPRTHGVRDNALFRLPDEVETLAERLGESGYQTAAFVSAFVLDEQFGLAQGFAHYDDELGESGGAAGVEERGAEAVTASFLDWFTARGEAPFFAWLHYYDPHYPYQPLPQYRAAFANRPYDAEIRRVDDQLDRVFTALDQAGCSTDTLIVLTSDHGEGLGDHGEQTHGHLVFQSTMRIPLLFAHPEFDAGSRDQVASITDVFPTVLEFLDLDATELVDGKSLLAGLRDPPSSPPAPHVVYMESELPRIAFGFRPLAAVSDGSLKLVDGPTTWLFDLEADPGETQNLAEERSEDVERLRAELARIRTAPSFAAAEGPAHGVRTQMENLGYSVGSATTIATRDDWTLDELHEALLLRNRLRDLLMIMDLEGVLRAADRLAEIAPDAYDGHEIAGTALANRGRHDEAVARLTRALELQPNLADARWNLATCLYHLGDEDAAAQQLEELVQRHPRHAQSRLMLAERALAQQLVDEARAHLAIVLESAPGTPYAARATSLLEQLD